MDLNQLRNFVVVADCLNISKASRELSISQPALSRSIRSLEAELNALLIVRSSSGLRLTDQGERLLLHARSILGIDFQMRQELNTMNKNTGMITIACRCMERFLPDILSEYRKLAPDVNFTILQNDDIALQNSHYDLLISGNLKDESGYTKHFLMKERLLCALPRSFTHLYEDRITGEEYSALPQIHFGGHRQIQSTISTLLEENGLKFHPDILCDDVRTACKLVGAGLGTLIIPEYALDEDLLKNITLLPLEGMPVKRDICLYLRSNSPLPRYAEKFIHYLVHHCRREHSGAKSK